MNHNFVSMSMELYPEKSFHQKLNGTILNLSVIPPGKENLRSVEWPQQKQPLILVEDSKVSGKNESLDESSTPERNKLAKKDNKQSFREKAILMGLAKLMVGGPKS